MKIDSHLLDRHNITFPKSGLKKETERSKQKILSAFSN